MRVGIGRRRLRSLGCLPLVSSGTGGEPAGRGEESKEHVADLVGGGPERSGGRAAVPGPAPGWKATQMFPRSRRLPPAEPFARGRYLSGRQAARWQMRQMSRSSAMPARELAVTVDCKNPTALRAVRLLV